MSKWKTVKLGDVCETITKGTTPTSLGLKFSNSGIRFLRVHNINCNNLIFSANDLFICNKTHNALSRSLIKPNDLLITIAGTIGRVAVVPENFPIANCNQAVGIIRLSDSVFNRFLLYWFNSSGAINQILQNKVTATISNLSLSQISNLQIPLPPLDEQKRIAAILDQADELRRKRQHAITRLNQLSQAIFYDMFGEGEFPQFRLKEIANVVTGTTPPTNNKSYFGGNLPFVTPSDLESNRPSTRTLSKSGGEKSRIVKAGSALVCCIGATIGKVKLINEDSAFNQQINAVVWNHEIIPEYGLWALKHIKPIIVHKGKGSSTTLPILKKSEFEKLKISVPPVSFQLNFVKKIKQIDEICLKNEASLIHKNTLFASLQYKAFCGEL